MKPNTLLDAIRNGDTAKSLLLLEHGADPFRHGVVWMHQALAIEPPHYFRRYMALRNFSERLDDIINGVSEEPDSENGLPTMIVTPIQMALLTQNVELVEKLFDLGAQPESRVLAIYPDHEDVRKAKAQILARLAKEPPHAPEVEMEYDPSPGGYAEWTHLACRVIGVLLQDPRKATSYPEMVENLDLLRWADYVGAHPALLEPFRSGRKLEPSV